MHGKKSETAYKLLENFNHFSLVSFFPKTGRTIKFVFMLVLWAFRFLAMKNMVEENKKSKDSFQNIVKFISELLNQFKGHALHANKITFLHPRTNKEVTFIAEIPKLFLEFIKSVKHKYEK